jgi:hypothetical protein
VLCREEVAAIVAVLAVAAMAWLITDVRMAGMDADPWTDPGSLAFYTSTWFLMMVAMMLPSTMPEI